MPEGIRSLEAAGSKHGIDFNWTEFDWSCETYLKTGSMMPEDGIEQLGKFDAIYLGAAGFPTVPDHISLWGLLIPIRREFEVRDSSSFSDAANPFSGSWATRQRSMPQWCTWSR